jgi:hypothetical protein
MVVVGLLIVLAFLLIAYFDLEFRLAIKALL